MMKYYKTIIAEIRTKLEKALTIVESFHEKAGEIRNNAELMNEAKEKRIAELRATMAPEYEKTSEGMDDLFTKLKEAVKPIVQRFDYESTKMAGAINTIVSMGSELPKEIAEQIVNDFSSPTELTYLSRLFEKNGCPYGAAEADEKKKSHAVNMEYFDSIGDSIYYGSHMGIDSVSKNEIKDVIDRLGAVESVLDGIKKADEE